ncbi:hemin-degrading factor [Roseicitreum antarcticum]|uniref:Putative hemin transport protein n=1 Tax=Roseicitreum antarcticum TaxID=564137 RepID=A0A1H2UB44_9RHOB|nr:ChuX/HutX family heme-like substrate-binding protein [Roseicitreum antarcticum]SDW52684.1 putative hemin transport protein [Roseicitreum antarcticum]
MTLDTLDSIDHADPATLRQARLDRPKLRARDLAEILGVAEGALVAAHVDGAQVIRIDPILDRLMPAIHALGDVMALTRNASVVHERCGSYEGYHSGNHASMVLGSEIDLRMFPRHWVHGFALLGGPRPSVQIFDAAGDAVHKVWLTDASDVAAFDALVAELRLADQSDTISLTPRTPVEAAQARPDKRADLHREWAAMTDTHQFLRLVSKVKMNRLGAYRTVGDPWVEALAPQAVTDLLHACAAQSVPLMLFVGNQGCIQIHSGTIHRVEPMGPWLNILDPRFNLHLRADHIAEVWHVTKPTKHGLVHSVEAFAADGALIVQIFAKRAPEAEAFAALLPGLPRQIAVGAGGAS